MIIHKKIIFIILLIFVVSDVFAEDSNSIKIKMLTEQNQSLNNVISQQRDIINYLIILCEQANIRYDLTAPLAASFKSKDITDKERVGNRIFYRGKKRTQKWLDRMYERFGENYWMVDGKVLSSDLMFTIYDIFGFNEGQYLNAGQKAILRNCRVTSVISSTEILVCNSRNNQIFHIHGLGYDYIDNEQFPDIIIESTGTYQYTTVAGTKSTVLSAKVCNTSSKATKSQFANALSGGLKLYNKRKIGKKITKVLVP